MKNKKLTFLESLALVAGAGIGTGILTIPYAINKIGMMGTLVALVIAFTISLFTYMIVADLAMNSKDSSQILGIFEEHLFKGKWKNFLKNLFFIVFTVILIENLIVYILCASNIITELFSLTPIFSKILFYLLACTVILFGIKGVGIGEKFSVTAIGTVILTLIIAACFNVENTLNFGFGEPKLIVAVYGLFMFAFSTIFSIVQVSNHIENSKDIKKVIIGGLSINSGLTLIFTLASLLASKEVTEVATIGLTESLGNPVIKVMSSIFVLLAMFSSYWSIGLAFRDIIVEQFNVNEKSAWFISTIPTILLAVLLPLSVLDYVQIGAGALSIIVGIMVLPAYYQAVKNSDNELLLGKYAKNKILIWIVGIFTFIMAISSFIPID